MKKLIEKIQSTCGMPDAAEGCRIILALTTEMASRLSESPEVYLAEKRIGEENMMFPASGNIPPTHKAKLVEITRLS